MSVARNSGSRSLARRNQSSPYRRPQSSWSLSRLIEPITRTIFGSSGTQEGDHYDEEDEEEQSRSPSPATTRELSPIEVDGEVMEPPRSPSKTKSPGRRPLVEGSSMHAILDNVVDYITDATGTALKRDEARALANAIQKVIPGERTVSQSLLQGVGRPLGAIEVEGMISLIHKQMPAQHTEPFRFQSVEPSRAPPAAGPAAPRKMLSKNPNGSYRWQGAGSAKAGARKNRYASPAFAAPNSVADGKRRRIDNEPPTVEDSPPQNQLPYPISSARTTTAPPAPATPSRLRTNTATAPSHPSPLRQAWTGMSPNNSSEDLSKDPALVAITPTKQTAAASVLSELIKEATPPKKPDLSNPYQTANPHAKVGPPRRATRKTRSSAKAPEPEPPVEKEQDKEEEAMDEYLPQAIFEATVPKGSKRSRPPPTVQKSASAEDGTSQSYTVEEVEDDDRSSKKQKSMNGTSSSSGSSDILIEEVAASNSSTPTSSISGSTTNGLVSKNNFSNFKPATAPSRPSKLRNSYLPEGSAPSSPTSTPATEAPPPPTIASTFTSLPPIPPKAAPPAPVHTPAPPAPGPQLTAFTPAPKVSLPSVAPVEPKAAAMLVNVENLPTYTFTLKSTSYPSSHAAACEAAKLKPVSSLPTMDFSRGTLKAGPSTVKPAASTSGTTNGFNWSAAGMKSASSASAATWTCNTCMLSNPDTAKDKCTVCDEPRPGASSTFKTTSMPSSAASAPTSLVFATGFNWAAAGMAPPKPAADKTWNCGACMLDNPDSAKDKCKVCDEPRPGAKTVKPLAPAPAFNWAAAGIKLPTSSASTWTCGTCCCTSPSSATKCTVCDEPR